MMGGIKCSCVKCDCTRILEDRVVKVHLYKNGFKPNYWIWTKHGKDMPHVDLNEGNNTWMFQLVQNMWLNLNNLC